MLQRCRAKKYTDTIQGQTAVLSFTKSVKHDCMQLYSSYRNKVVLLQTNHISNFDVPPLWLLKPEAAGLDQCLCCCHFFLKFLKLYLLYKLKGNRKLTLLQPAIQQHFTLSVVDLLVHPVTSLEESENKGVTTSQILLYDQLDSSQSICNFFLWNIGIYVMNTFI